MRAGRAVPAARGFTYLGVLIAIALIGVGLTAASEVWVTTAHRQKLAQLDWVGAQFVRAIGSYRDASPGSVKANPKTLADLLEDRRYLTMRRHLREIYRDPFTGSTSWTLIADPRGGVVGVVAKIPSVAGNGTQAKEYRYVEEQISLTR
jgi:type II secretory pathway pseudopilin PulG